MNAVTVDLTPLAAAVDAAHRARASWLSVPCSSEAYQAHADAYQLAHARVIAEADVLVSGARWAAEQQRAALAGGPA